MKIKTKISDYKAAPQEMKLPWVGTYAATNCIILFYGQVKDGLLNGVVLHPGQSALLVGDVDEWTAKDFKPYYGTIIFETTP